MKTLNKKTKSRRIGAKLLHLAIAFVLAAGIVIPVGSLANPEEAYGAVDDTFTAVTIEGVSVNYEILTESGSTGTVQVRSAVDDQSAIPKNTTGPITIPETVTPSSGPNAGTVYTVTAIGRNAFLECTSLTSVNIPDSIKSIRGASFTNCYALTSVNIPDGVTSIGEAAFQRCGSLTSITLPGSVTSMGEEVFLQCGSLTSVNILNGMTFIPPSTFWRCTSLSAITIPDSVTSIGRAAFLQCSSLTSITLPGSITSISDGLFSFCTSLSDVTIPDTVTSIGNAAFNKCSSLVSIEIPNSVTSIGPTFISDSGVQRLIFKGTSPPVIQNNTFDNALPPDGSLHEIIVPTGCEPIYKTAWLYKAPSTILDFIRGYVAVADISLSPASAAIPIGTATTLAAIFSPGNATNKDLEWTSDDESVATVTQTGKVTAVSVGTATITATSVDNASAAATCAVTVTQPVTGLTLSDSSLSIARGADYTLTATIAPTDATDKTVDWTSSNTGVATVDRTGKVTAVGLGTATITATSADNPSAEATCAVTVFESITGIEVLPRTKIINVDDDYVLTAEVNPPAADQNVIWSSSDPSVASVSRQGRIYGISRGNAVITATSASEPAKFATCAVKVKDADDTNVGNTATVNSVVLSRTDRLMTLGDDYVLLADVLPKGADQRVVWTSSDTNIATIDSRGRVWAAGLGNADITATSVADPAKSATCAIEVTEDTNTSMAGIAVPVSGIALTPASLTLSVLGSEFALTADVVPAAATNKTVIWESDDWTVAAVSQSGKVYPVGEGSANITATTADGGVTAACAVTVTGSPGGGSGGSVSPAGITLSRAEKTMPAGTDYVLLSEITPADADQSVTWSSSDADVATITQRGLVFAKGKGTATIKATSVADPTLSAECVITVTDGTENITPASITLSKNTKTMYEGDDYLLVPSFTPADTTDKTVNWTSSDEAVAAVDEKGSVTALASGSATITAVSASSPSVTADCVVTVLPADVEPAPVEGSSLTAAVDNRDVKLAWKIPGPGSSGGAHVGIVYYIIYYKEGTVTDTNHASPAWDGAKLQRTTEAAATVENLEKEKTYSFLVVAENSKGQASGGAVVSVSIPGDAADVVTIEVFPITKTINVDDDYVLTAEIEPQAADQSVIWSSSDPSVVSVSRQGRIYGISKGNAVITATSASDSTKSATCAVKVKDADDTNVGNTAAVNSVVLSRTDRLMTLRDDYVLLADVLPANADQRVVWTSSDTNVATVDGRGRVWAAGLGNADITATSVADPSKSAVCAIEVADDTNTSMAGIAVPVSGITITPSSLTLSVQGSEFALTADVAPADATNRTVVWESDDWTVAAVSQSGKVYPIGAGSANITATTADGGFTDTCAVAVTGSSGGGSGGSVSPSGISLSKTGKTMPVGSDYVLLSEITPAEADQSVTWSSSDTNVATVSGRGQIFARSKGTADIKATSVADPALSSECAVTVTDGTENITPASITLSKNTKTMYEGDDYLLTSSFTPADATDKTVNWTSSDETVAAVDGKGNVTALAFGFATITATSVSNPSATANCDVSVLPADVEPASVDGSSLTASVEDAQNVKLAWKIPGPGSSGGVHVGIVYYNIHYKEGTVTDTSHASPAWNGAKLQRAAAANATVENLEKGKTYSFLVVAENSFGKAPDGAVVSVAIPKDADDVITITGPDKYTYKAGDETHTLQLNATSSAGNPITEWAVDRADIATISQTGLLSFTGAEGDINVTAKTAEAASAPKKITVVKEAKAADVVTVTAPDKYTYKQADKTHTLQLNAASSAGNPITEWAVDNPSVATISQTGLLTFTGAEGDINVTAKTSEAASAPKKITAVRNVTAIATPMKTIYIQRGKSFSVPAVAYDGNTKIAPKLTWATSNAKIAKVVNGKITISKKIKKGKATITARSANGKVLSIKVNVSKKAVKLKGVTVKAPKTLKLKKTKFLTVRFKQKKATGVKITFKSNKPKGLEVDKAGKLTAKKKGKYKITIKCGKKKVVKKIRVK